MSGVSINQSISISSTSTPCPSATMLVAARASTSKQAPPRIHQVVHLMISLQMNLSKLYLSKFIFIMIILYSHMPGEH